MKEFRRDRARIVAVTIATLLIAGGGVIGAIGLGNQRASVTLTAGAVPRVAAADTSLPSLSPSVSPIPQKMPTTAMPITPTSPTSSAVPTSSTLPACGGASGPVVHATAKPIPGDTRIRSTFESDGYRSDELALANYRMDPAPGLIPRLTAASALAAARQNGIPPDGGDPVIRFGLFSGSDVVVGPPPNHLLGGNTPITCRPAWLVVVNGQECVSKGVGAFAAGTIGKPAAPPKATYRCGTVAVVDDDTSGLLGAITYGPEVSVA